MGNSEELYMGAVNNLSPLTGGILIWKTSVEILQSSGLCNRQTVWPEGSNPGDVSMSIAGKESRKKSVLVSEVLHTPPHHTPPFHSTIALSPCRRVGYSYELCLSIADSNSLGRQSCGDCSVFADHAMSCFLRYFCVPSGLCDT